MLLVVSITYIHHFPKHPAETYHLTLQPRDDREILQGETHEGPGNARHEGSNGSTLFVKFSDQFQGYEGLSMGGFSV